MNVKGVLAGTKAVLADMIACNEGTIINISSIAGRKTFDNHSVYCGTKYAVHAITESMRKEVSGSNVRMIVIAPGVVETLPCSPTPPASRSRTTTISGSRASRAVWSLPRSRTAPGLPTRCPRASACVRS